VPKVSVVIPTYNCVCFLPKAIDSVLAQTYQDFEIIVVDDGSTDGTRDLMQSYLGKFPGKIRYFYQENQGLTARNTGIEHAGGHWIAFLDSDDLWVPERLEEEMHVADAQPDVGLIHANIMWMRESGELVGPADRQKKFLDSKIFENLLLWRADIACSTVLFRKEYCMQLGMIDKNLARLGAEDRYLWLRFAQQFKIIYVPKVLAYYRIRKESSSRKLDSMEKARVYIVNKFCKDKQYVYLKRAALSKIYRDLGDAFLLLNDFTNARRKYLQSLFWGPFLFWTWVNLCKAILRVKI